MTPQGPHCTRQKGDVNTSPSQSGTPFPLTRQACIKRGKLREYELWDVLNMGSLIGWDDVSSSLLASCIRALTLNGNKPPDAQCSQHSPTRSWQKVHPPGSTLWERPARGNNFKCIWCYRMWTDSMHHDHSQPHCLQFGPWLWGNIKDAWYILSRQQELDDISIQASTHLLHHCLNKQLVTHKLSPPHWHPITDLDINGDVVVCPPHTYLYVYIYAVASKLGPRFGFFWVETWSKVAPKLNPRFVCLFSQFYSVFSYLKKSTNSVWGCENTFWAVCQGVKTRVFKNKYALLVFVFLC